MDIAQTKFDLANAKQKLAVIQRSVPYCVQEELKVYLEVESLEDGLLFAESILAERF
jgi:hypothetical protein